jgi:uncharacterized protein (TIRG00374 family)
METEVKDHRISGPDQLWKRLLRQAIRIAVGVLVLSLVVSLVQWQNVLAAYRTADTRYIYVGAVLLMVNLGVRTLKWYTMLHSVKESPTIWEAFGSVMLGISLGSFTPGEIGEFAGRALHISDAQRSHLVGLALLDKAQIFLVTSIAGILGLAFLMITNTLLLVIITAGSVPALLILLFRMELIANTGHRINASFFKRPWLTKVLEGFTLLQPRQVALTSLLTLVFHSVVVLQMYFLLCSFATITLVQAFIGTSALLFVKSLLPISLGDLGIREAGSILFFSSFGISQAAALNASLLLFVINVFVPSVMGTYFLRYHNFSPSSFLHFLKKRK